ncbi:MAG: HlyD family efflux transporter periplasmic adaptor subunit [Desulfobacterales bacterium]|nr:HlyD family efflux transporter periplasmic adaptor subunit [Desulfobacterales bacterium]
MSSHITGNNKPSIQNFLKVQWIGLRHDLVLHPGPVDHDGQRSYVLEDPVRGNNFRLGYTEGELLFRLMTEPDPDKAVATLYNTTALRPSVEEIVSFITMLQNESLAVLPKEEIIRREVSEFEKTNPEPGVVPSFVHTLLKGAISFTVPLIRPDAFLTQTLPYVSFLWSSFARRIYFVCGLIGLFLTLQETELYFGTVSYLFTPQGWLTFAMCVILLKTGHEFAHAYTAKAMGLHIRSMGMFFIVLWPLLYTDTTDAWKISDRQRRMWISAAGVLFEITVGGIALLLWALLPDGILRSLMFFFSGTSLSSSILINLNPFMRFDAYYLLMDYWGIDNLRSRSSALLRYETRRLLLDWKGPVPEIHPYHRKMVIYGMLAFLYRLSVSFSIAIAVYYFFFPVLGLILLATQFWMFIVRPLRMEISSIVKDRKYLGSTFRLALTTCGIIAIAALFFIPVPRVQKLPCLLLNKESVRVSAPNSGRLPLPMPIVNQRVKPGQLITRITDDSLMREALKVRFDLESVRASINRYRGGGEEGAYRNWLIAEEKRLITAAEKIIQVSALMEIRSPVDGRIADVNKELYEGAFVARGTYLFTIANPYAFEVKAYVHENLVGKMEDFGNSHGNVRFPELKAPTLHVTLREKSTFPVQYMPNKSLFDYAGGPIVSVEDKYGRKPRDAYFTFTFDVSNAPEWLPHGMPSWIWVWSERRSVATQVFGTIWKNLIEREII